ncbi:glycosyltransferase [Pseudorhodobacter sp.]|uniref:glycosyltransferase n=1 Tax=Pseudorhodobacter sp. TaxID=1934400 RepID=UPI0026499E10|nr:glycosyltransferase [Pseudorhodobacter sp.]MDN5788110.1 glycosyltransferase [Pseudorhodobacter sp.]
MLPEVDFPADPRLYLRLAGAASQIPDQAAIRFGQSGQLRGDCYFNLFNLGKWQTRCGLGTLSLIVQGKGDFEVTIWQAGVDEQRQRLTVQQVSCRPKQQPGGVEVAIALAPCVQAAVLYYDIRVLGTQGRITALDWVTRQAPVRQPRLMLSITTFRREAAVARTAARFESFIRQSPLATDIDMVIVDNGSSVHITESDKLRVIANENLGGAGGFARGLIEARARGASHCLFMDDDAAIHMTSLERTWVFLAYATDPATAVAGAISSGSNPAILWENGAVFASQCRPCYNGTDLRNPAAVIEMELETTAPPPQQHYGGWWFFAFPVDHAHHMPFPFFVRGDDISFSLANAFSTVTLPGVMSFQDMGFSERESLMTLYLDLRSHLAHHLSLPALDIGRWRTARIAAWFFARSLYSCHYETLAALNQAVEDVLCGPDFFAANADLITRRAQIAALRDAEKWRDIGPTAARRTDRAHDSIRFALETPLQQRLMKLTMNGHLLPFFAAYGNRVTLGAQDRGAIRKILGAARITYRDAAHAQSYTVHHDKARAFRQSLRMVTNICRLLWRYNALKSSWTKGYATLTLGGFWQSRLGCGTSDTPNR